MEASTVPTRPSVATLLLQASGTFWKQLEGLVASAMGFKGKLTWCSVTGMSIASMRSA